MSCGNCKKCDCSKTKKIKPNMKKVKQIIAKMDSSLQKAMWLS